MDLIYAQSACNTPKRKENLKSQSSLFHFHFFQLEQPNGIDVDL